MDFRFTPQELAFRDELRDFLANEWPGGSGDSIIHNSAQAEQEKAFVRKLAERGWLTMAWPSEYGGSDATHVMQAIMKEECAYAQVTGLGGPGGQGVGMVGPSIIVHGSEDQKHRFLPKIASGEVTWCQGFSEPGAGSDLAAVQTKAVRDGDNYVISGHKIWTSAAGYSDWIHLLARTDPEVPKHRGISYFLIDMKSAGITYRPIVEMTGHAGFYETYFDNVVVPRENMLGEENRGWYVATTTLDLERAAIHRIGYLRRWLEWTIAHLRSKREPTPEPVRNQLADHAVGLEVGRWLAYRVAWMGDHGLIANHESSMSKAYISDLTRRFSDTAINALGLAGAIRSGSPHEQIEGRPSLWFLMASSHTILGGTNEIQKNIVAQRGLALPRAD